MSDYPSMVHVQHIEFEGCDCVVMSPEEYGAALADLEAKDHELDSLRIALKESEAGELRNALAVGQAVIELQEERKELDRLRAANARLQAWHDAVVAARVVDAVDIGTAAMVLRQANGRILELQDAVDEIERRSVKAIIRPQPLAKE